jgi:hypothetical protein
MAYEMETNQVGLSTIMEAFVLLGYLLERFVLKREENNPKREKNRRTKKMAPTTRKTCYTCLQ